MSRLVTTLGLMQCACVLLGFLALGIVLKVCGYPNENPMVVWSPFSVFLRSFGLWFLVVPACWTVFASVGVPRTHGRFTESLIMLTGVVLAMTFALTFLYAAVFPFHRVLLLAP